MMYLLDTNTCIFVINNRSETVRTKMKAVKVGTVALSTITVSELRYGVAKSAQVERNQAALDKFLMPLEVLPYDDGAARCYGAMRAYLESQGTPIGPMDLMIAAHALSAGLIVVTNNTREFQRIPNLRVEDWTAESAD